MFGITWRYYTALPNHTLYLTVKDYQNHNANVLRAGWSLTLKLFAFSLPEENMALDFTNIWFVHL